MGTVNTALFNLTGNTYTIPRATIPADRPRVNRTATFVNNVTRDQIPFVSQVLPANFNFDDFIASVSDGLAEMLKEGLEGAAQIRSATQTVWGFLPKGVKVAAAAYLGYKLWKLWKGSEEKQQTQTQNIVVNIAPLDYGQLADAVQRQTIKCTDPIDYLKLAAALQGKTPEEMTERILQVANRPSSFPTEQ